MTRYELFRRRIAPILFLGIVALIFFDAWRKQERTHATIVLDFGAAAPHVRAVEAELFVDGESVGTFRRTALPEAAIGPSRFEARMPDDRGELRVAVDLASGERRQLTRRIHADEGATITVSLGADLAP